MKKWRVKLSDGAIFILESDTPNRDLVARGHEAFALEEITGGLPLTKFHIPQWVLDATIEGMQDLARRLEADAVTLSRMDTTESRILAKARLEKAWEARQAFEYLVHL